VGPSRQPRKNAKLPKRHLDQLKAIIAEAKVLINEDEKESRRLDEEIRKELLKW
jgi:hypothetical protein